VFWNKRIAANKYKYEIIIRSLRHWILMKELKCCYRKIKRKCWKLKADYQIQISWHRVQKLLAAFWAVYGLRWKFIQIQTQQVWIFRIFLLYARPPTTLRKTYIHGLSQLKSRKMIIIFFASLGKNKYLRMSLLQSRCKTNLWKHRFFSKKRNAVTSS